jgi:LCP family protein required for cell wall assembly
MRTTLKRGIGRGGAVNGNGRAVLPPGALSPVTRYRQPLPPPRSGFALFKRIFAWIVMALLVAAGSVAGGAYLWFHESIAAVAASTPDVKLAAKRLDVPLPGEPAIALVVGYDKRAGEAEGDPSRSDTLMLVRADPGSKAISMLSFPRDLIVDIKCPGRSSYRSRINEAYTVCGSKGTLETVKGVTGLPINYLITVNFRGFRTLVDKLGGVWLDIDRRYFNDRGGPFGFATINLFPGYQKLGGYQALDYVRYRHTDSDLYRVARQQQFVRAFKDQIKSSFGATKLPGVIKTVTDNVEVGQGGGDDIAFDTVLSYALFAYGLPPGHFFQSRIEGLEGYAELSTAQENITRAVQEFAQPDVEAPAKATDVALGVKPKSKAPPPRDTTISVLNGNGVTGSATNAGYLLGQRGYAIVTPPNGQPANAPSCIPPETKDCGFGYFDTRVYFDPEQTGAQPAAKKVATLFGSAGLAQMTPEIALLSNGAMLVVTVGQTFHGNLAEAPVDRTPVKQEASVAPGADASLQYLRDRAGKLPFELMVPTVIERNSWIDREKPVFLYRIDEARKHKALRLTYRTGGGEYWGVQMTDWEEPPILAERNFDRTFGGRKFELHYSGPKLHMVVLREGGATYWVVNTLLDTLSNETMFAIAKGLKPLSRVK